MAPISFSSKKNKSRFISKSQHMCTHAHVHARPFQSGRPTSRSGASHSQETPAGRGGMAPAAPPRGPGSARACCHESSWDSNPPRRRVRAAWTHLAAASPRRHAIQPPRHFFRIGRRSSATVQIGSLQLVCSCDGCVRALRAAHF